MEVNILYKDVRIHQRIFDAQKYLLQGTGNFMEESIKKETSIE